MLLDSTKHRPTTGLQATHNTVHGVWLMAVTEEDRSDDRGWLDSPVLKVVEDYWRIPSTPSSGYLA